MSHLYEKQQALQLLQRIGMKLNTREIGMTYFLNQCKIYDIRNIEDVIKELCDGKLISNIDNVITLLE